MRNLAVQVLRTISPIGLKEHLIPIKISGVFFFLAANKGFILVIGYNGIKLDEYPIFKRIFGAFFYLAANKDFRRFILPRCERGS